MYRSSRECTSAAARPAADTLTLRQPKRQASVPPFILAKFSSPPHFHLFIPGTHEPHRPHHPHHQPPLLPPSQRSVPRFLSAALHRKRSLPSGTAVAQGLIARVAFLQRRGGHWFHHFRPPVHHSAIRPTSLQCSSVVARRRRLGRERVGW